MFSVFLKIVGHLEFKQDIADLFVHSGELAFSSVFDVEIEFVIETTKMKPVSEDSVFP